MIIIKYRWKRGSPLRVGPAPGPLFRPKVSRKDISVSKSKKGQSATFVMGDDIPSVLHLLLPKVFAGLCDYEKFSILFNEHKIPKFHST